MWNMRTVGKSSTVVKAAMMEVPAQSPDISRSKLTGRTPLRLAPERLLGFTDVRDPSKVGRPVSEVLRVMLTNVDEWEVHTRVGLCA